MHILSIPNEFFTLQSMLTLASATTIVFVISNSIQTAFNYNPKWLALAVSLIISIAGVYFSQESTGANYFVGIINGFLIYATASGTMQIVGRPQPNQNTITPSALADTERKFFTRWW